MGICTVLFLIFMTLKLAGFIFWSWWLVTAPLWIEVIVGIVILLVTWKVYQNRQKKLNFRNPFK